MRRGSFLLLVSLLPVACHSGPTKHRPFPQVPNSGGVVMSNLDTLVTVVASNDSLADGRLAAFSDILLQSVWWADLASEYHLPATVRNVHRIGPPIASDLSDSDIQQYLNELAATDGPAPNGRTIYLLYLPVGVGFAGNNATARGYHNPWVDAAQQPTGDAWAVVRRYTSLETQAWSEPELQLLTQVASHEIAEAVTDPVPGQGFSTSWNDYPWTASVWMGEVGDLCEGEELVDPANPGYRYSRIWSNRAAVDGGDPCMPPVAGPYFSVTTPQDWYEVPAAGGAVTIPLKGWSTAPRSDWTINVEPYIISTENVEGLALGAGLQLHSSRGDVPDGGACPARPLMNDGVAATLTVTMPATAKEYDFVTLRLESQELSTDCSPPLSDDFSHPWIVGVYVRPTDACAENGATSCGGHCTNLQTDPQNCGGCGYFYCSLCVRGRCANACPDGQSVCGGTCTKTLNDPQNCGACGYACPAGQVCDGAGECARQCRPGYTECAGRCVDLRNDLDNCGLCGNACLEDTICSAGNCQPKCPDGTSLCGGGSYCADLSSSNDNCGGCHVICPAGQICNGTWQCVDCIAVGKTDCNGSCVDLATDWNNCGTCGSACAQEQICEGGQCVP